MADYELSIVSPLELERDWTSKRPIPFWQMCFASFILDTTVVVCVVCVCVCAVFVTILRQMDLRNAIGMDIHTHGRAHVCVQPAGHSSVVHMV